MACQLDDYSLIYGMFTSEEPGGEKKLSKRERKRLERGDEPTKKEKDPNRWVVDPAKAKAKAEKAARAKKQSKNDDDDDAIAPETPAGEKKKLALVMAKAYDPQKVEASWQEWWEKQGWYGCDPVTKGEKFVIVIPPPNVTGSLHLGHALTAAIEDCLTRWHRMRGDATLYVPGTDHAGIATQSVVEKMLAKSNVTRHDLGREKFVQEVWKWKDQYGSRICRQLRRLGSSVDWARERFTMDPMLSKAVTEAFVRLHEKKLMYRASRLVNWSCALKSAISDLEVDYVDIEGVTKRKVPNCGEYEFGTFTEFAYEIIDPKTKKLTGEKVIVATTRLETMLGDTAVAVHPKDPRYTHLHKMKARHPFFPERELAIVLDDVLVDMNLGTGCVKITPAHDPNDYECGKRHDLPFITILNVDGTIASEATPFHANTGKSSKNEKKITMPSWVAGKPRYEARILVEEKLKEAGLFQDKYPKPMRLAICSRSGDIIEPLVQPQWFCDCTDMARRACDAVKKGELRILPAMHERTWFHWLENIRPWCVSRQLWWGHQVPAWFAYAKSDLNDMDKNDASVADRWIVARTEDEAEVQAKKILGSNYARIQRDDDVLDTWFSSGLFPFAVFGWPDSSPDLDAFYPTTLLETGLDILFFWVARMLMLALELTDKLPFTDVYLHAMVRDKDGRKMSKSLGNVIDPLEVIDGCPLETLIDRLKAGNLRASEVQRAEKAHRDDFPDGIPKCGTDALRIGLLAYTVQGRDINLDIKRVVGYRMFCNKLWNAVRFMLGVFGDFQPKQFSSLNVSSPRDKFILSRLYVTLDQLNAHLHQYTFGDAVRCLYEYFLNDLCDVYLEFVKPIVYGLDTAAAVEAKKTLWVCLDAGLRALHPFCPFVTEELWQRLPRPDEEQQNLASIMIAPYPTIQNLPFLQRDQEVEAQTSLVLACATAGRSLRAQYDLRNKQTAKFYVLFKDPVSATRFENQQDDFATLVNAESVTILRAYQNDATPDGCAITIVDEVVTVLIDLKGVVDVAAEIRKLEKQVADLQPLITKLEAKQADPTYLAKAPEKQRLADQDKLTQYADRRDTALAAITMWQKTL